jgi:hypothetical protein
MLWFVLIDGAGQALEQQHDPWQRRGLSPVLHDREVITVALIAETWFHGDEALALSVLGHDHSDLFPRLPGLGHCNARRSVPEPLIDQIRRALGPFLGAD